MNWNISINADECDWKTAFFIHTTDDSNDNIMSWLQDFDSSI